MDKKPQPIIISENNIYKPIIEDAKTFNESIFKEVYKLASENVIEIMEERERENKSQITDCNKNLESIYNNVIGFMGERGSGKTSSMLSFAKCLGNLDDMVYLSSTSSFEQSAFYKISKSEAKFAIIDTIDPTLIGDNESIVQVIVSYLFQKYRKEVKNDFSNKNTELIDMFTKIFNSIQLISNEKRLDKLAENDPLEALYEMAISTGLRRSLCDLFETYLKEITRAKEGYIVIPIDDFDLNFNDSFKMVEEIRKYLMLPNVIILLSGKLEQLIDITQNEYKRVFKRSKNEDYASSFNTRTMAVRYWEKILPMGRRVEMPKW